MCLLALSTLLDYLYGFGVASRNKRTATLLLWLSVVNNLGILGVFKYYNFFATQFQQGFELLGLHTNVVLLQIALPIGISFYTFHGMSYVFDIYRGKQKPSSNFIDYAVFVSFFPLLVAGPIERANHLLPQVQRLRVFSYPQAVEGGRLILWGLFKKVVVADTIASKVDTIFMNYEQYSSLTLVFGAIAFSFQIYGDFSGYSDIALGVAKLFGFELLSNFRFPYFSRDIAEFWRRWHISLSSWFRDYLYIPLGGSQEGQMKAVRNVFIVFLVSGFWHGASWNFIAWGFIHACGFLPLLLFGQNRTYVSDVVANDRMLPNVKEIWQMVSTFAFVTFAWIFFRAEDLPTAFDYLNRMILGPFLDPKQLFQFPPVKSVIPLMVLLLLGDWWLRRDERRLRMIGNGLVRRLIYSVAMVILLIRILGTESESFIYFQF